MFDMENKFIMNIIYNINSKCVEYSNIDWKKVYDKYNVLHIKILNQLHDNGFLIKNAISDDYNKIYLVQLNNDLVLPIKQIGITDEYPLLKLTDVKLLDYSSSLKLISMVLKNIDIDISHLTKIVQDDTIVGLYLYNYIIPIKPSPFIDDSIVIKENMAYSININKNISNNIQRQNNRTLNINKFKFEEESYIRFRFTISKYIQKHINIKKIKQLLLQKKILKPKDNK